MTTPKGTIKSPLLAAREKHDLNQLSIMRKVDAVASVLQTTDRIMSGKSDLQVVISGHPPMETIPAWTDGEDIYLNKRKLWEMLTDGTVDSTEFVSIFKGTNYHELAHILFSPRKTDMVFRQIQRKIQDHGQGVWFAYMVLEDQRIETLYTTLYGATKPYFEAAALRWILHQAGTEGLHNSYPLLYGRRYLSPHVRAKSRVLYKKHLGLAGATPNVKFHGGPEGFVQKVESVIDAYLQVVFPSETPKAVSLIMTLFELMLGQKDNKSQCSNKATIEKGRLSAGETVEAVETLKDQDEEQQKEFEEAKEKAEKEQSAAPADNDDEDDDEDDDGDEGADGAGDGEDGSEGDGSRGDGSGRQEANQDAQNESGEGAGGHTSKKNPGGDRNGKNKMKPGEGSSDGDSPLPGPSKSINNMEDELESAVNDALRQVENDESLKRDVQDTMKAIRRVAEGQQDAKGNYGKFSMVDVDSESVSASMRITRLIRELRSQVEPAWQRNEDEGRLNIRRALRSKVDPNILNVFDKWDEGVEDDASVEVVILLDLSYSMASIIGRCSKALWTLKRAFDRCDVRTTVLGFSDGSCILYKPSEKAMPNKVRLFGVWGSTNPDTAVKQAWDILSCSEAKNKIFVAITDGAWQGNVTKMNDRIMSMRRHGITTLLFCFGNNVLQQGGTHNCELVFEIGDIQEVVTVVKGMVAKSIKRAAMERR